MKELTLAFIQMALLCLGHRAVAQDNSTGLLEQRVVSRLQARGVPAETVTLEPAPELADEDRPATIAYMRSYDVKAFRARIRLQSGTFLLCSKFVIYSKVGDPLDIQKTIGDCAF